MLSSNAMHTLCTCVSLPFTYDTEFYYSPGEEKTRGEIFQGIKSTDFVLNLCGQMYLNFAVEREKVLCGFWR